MVLLQIGRKKSVLVALTICAIFAAIKFNIKDVVYIQRRQESEAWCRQMGSGQGRGVHMWVHYNHTAYCILPKVGCTFWKNVFRYLHGDTGGNYPSPFHIPRIYTHNGPMRSMRIYHSRAQAKFLKDQFRFMFVREPYSRLFSAYVDKFLLPDFWTSVGRHIAKLRANKANLACGRDISFREFLDYVVNHRPAQLNNHWKPMYQLCNPCLFRPHVIGKIETFTKDVKYVLRVMNSSWMLGLHSSHEHVLQEMDMITKYNFAIWKRKRRIRNCASRLQLSRLLWKAFQINGYLPSDKPFPSRLMDGLNTRQFISLVHDTYQQATNNRSSDWLKQKERMMSQAYRDISSDTLDKLKRIYKYDFLMFHYDPEPAIIFQHRKRMERI
ncbi:hypothetical protein ACOMHN_015159 [Nucella lapillus]